MKHRLVIGIDPDISKSGLAIWDEQQKKYLSVATISFEDIIDHLNTAIDPPFGDWILKSEVIIYLEAGHLNTKANFRRGQKSNVSETIAMRVGMNHATSMLLARMLKKHGWNVVEIAPLSKGKGLLKNLRGWTEFGKKFIRDKTGLTMRLNGEMLDALYIVESYKLRS